MEHYYSEASFKETNEGKIQREENNDLDLQILEMIEKSDGMWKCKVCGKTKVDKSHIREHAESHIEGMSHLCHICKTVILIDMFCVTISTTSTRNFFPVMFVES